MGRDDVFPAEMPDHAAKAIVPLDADTAERLLSGRLDPDDAPPGYAKVARLLRSAAAPPDPGELTGQAAAMAAFRLAHRGSAHPSRPGQGTGPAGRRAGRDIAGAARGPARAARGRARGARHRLVALALAGAVAVGGVGLWTAGGAPFPGELGSPSGGPSAGGRGSGAPGSAAAGSGVAGSGVPGSGAAEVLRLVRDGVGVVPRAASGRDGQPPAGPAAGEPAAARHGGDVTSGGGSGSGTGPKEPGKQGGHGTAKPKPPKPKPPKANGPKPNAPKANGAKPQAPKG
jgi:hypothetical protein